jgi:hypothetical protein
MVLDTDVIVEGLMKDYIQRRKYLALQEICDDQAKEIEKIKEVFVKYIVNKRMGMLCHCEHCHYTTEEYTKIRERYNKDARDEIDKLIEESD